MSTERITDPAQIRALHERQEEDKRRWSVAFDVGYDLCEEIHRMIDDRTRALPWEYRVAAYLYVVEHLGEHARFAVELPDAKPASEGTET